MKDSIRWHSRILKSSSNSGNLDPAEFPDVVQYVLGRWIFASRKEARILIDIMSNISSTSWLELLGSAHRHDIVHADLLLENQDGIYEQIANAAADKDGLTVPAS